MDYKKFVVGAIFLASFGLFLIPNAKPAQASCMDQNFSQRTNAEQIQCVTDMIADLQTQLARLKAQGSNTGAWCHTFNTNLGYANSGSDEITSLHSALRLENISYSPDGATAYTEATGAAVVQFQAKYGVTQTGYVGNLTRAKLNSLYGCKTTTPNVVSQPLTATCTGTPYSNGALGISWRVSASGGSGSYTYQWAMYNDVTNTGDSSINEPGRLVSYASVGSKSAETTVIDSHNTRFVANCSATIGSTPGLPTVNVTANGRGPIVPVQAGETVTLGWTSTNATSCYAYANDTLMNNVVLDGVANNFQGQTSGSVLVQPRSNITYKITCSNSSGQQASNSITLQVSSASTQPSITVTSPNGGELWKIGETHTITWNSTGFTSPSTAQILLIDPSQYTSHTIVSATQNTGSYSWTIPATMPGNRPIGSGNVYKIQIIVRDNSGIAKDDNSDTNFSIVTVTPSCVGYTNNSVVLNSMQTSGGTVSFNLTNTTSSVQSVLVSIGSGSVSQPTISIPSGACAVPASITYSAPSNTTITFIRAEQVIASLPVSPTTSPTIPLAPSNLTATTISSSQINLTWIDNSTNETGFKIERSTDNVTFTQISTTSANAATLNNTGLASNTTYYYRVRATNTVGDSAYSNTIYAKTQASGIRNNF